MAIIPSTGARITSLYEYETTLPLVMAELGLTPLNEESEWDLRLRLGRALGKWHEPHTGVDAGDLARTLLTAAKQLEKLDTRLAATEGLHHVENIVAALRLVEVLSHLPALESRKGAHAFIDRFRSDASIMATALRVVAIELRSIKGTGGKRAYHWYDEFALVIVGLCVANGIEVKPVNSRKRDEPAGRFFEVVQGFERLIAPQRRSPTPHALAKRINRSLKRMGTKRKPTVEPE